MSNPLNVKDILVALMFLMADESEPDTIVLRCAKSEHVPAIRRVVFRELGQPSFHFGDRLKYGVKTIIIAEMDKEVSNYDPDKEFYIPYDDESDWIELKREGGLSKHE